MTKVLFSNSQLKKLRKNKWIKKVSTKAITLI